jgi:tRNA pseudouridine38-40 synthase
MNNYRLVIQYDGTSYCGWQFQREKSTIQQKITEAVKILIKEDINIIGAGRTDSGVHAWGQVANFRCTRELDLYKFKFQLNSLLPFDIAIKHVDKVDENFHSRFDAVRRIYVYLISHQKSPFYNKYSHFYLKQPDINLLNEYSKKILGNYDFSSFSRKTNEEIKKECTVYNAMWKRTKGITLFTIEADRFLHGMVRSIVGTMLELEKSFYDASQILKILNKKNREAAGISIPAKGLFLYKVKY